MVALRDGYGVGELKEIAVLGERLEDVKVFDFKAPEFQDMMAKIPRPLMRFLKAYLTTQPAIIKEKCVECEMCLRACPRQCITHPAGAMQMNTDACIQCLCCMEICPQGAIELRPGGVLKIYSGIRRIFGRN
jgi:Fe-S-cluster-containing hydrogenase component 2